MLSAGILSVGSSVFMELLLLLDLDSDSSNGFAGGCLNILLQLFLTDAKVMAENFELLAKTQERRAEEERIAVDCCGTLILEL